MISYKLASIQFYLYYLVVIEFEGMIELTPLNLKIPQAYIHGSNTIPENASIEIQSIPAAIIEREFSFKVNVCKNYWPVELCIKRALIKSDIGVNHRFANEIHVTACPFKITIIVYRKPIVVILLRVGDAAFPECQVATLPVLVDKLVYFRRSKRPVGNDFFVRLCNPGLTQQDKG